MSGDYITSLPHLCLVTSPLWETRDGKQRDWALTQVQPGGAWQSWTLSQVSHAASHPFPPRQPCVYYVATASHGALGRGGPRGSEGSLVFSAHITGLSPRLCSLGQSVFILPCWSGTVDTCGFIQVQCQMPGKSQETRGFSQGPNTKQRNSDPSAFCFPPPSPILSTTSSYFHPDFIFHKIINLILPLVFTCFTMICTFFNVFGSD